VFSEVNTELDIPHGTGVGVGEMRFVRKEKMRGSFLTSITTSTNSSFQQLYQLICWLRRVSPIKDFSHHSAMVAKVYILSLLPGERF